jgi:hypothetical protein
MVSADWLEASEEAIRVIINMKEVEGEIDYKATMNAII